MSSYKWLGHCYDVLYINQFSLGLKEPYPLPSGATRTGTKENAAIVLNSENKSTYVDETVVAHTDKSSESNTIRSTSDYERKLGVSVTTGASFKVYSGSLSVDVKSRVKNTLGKSETTTLTTATRQTKQYSLLKEEDSDHPPLDADFQTALWSAASEELSSFTTFVSKYGTHFSNSVTVGGVGHQAFKFSSKNIAKLSELGVDTSVQASGVIKVIEVNGSIKNSVQINKQFEKEVESQSTKISYIGGADDSDFKAWLSSVDDNPVPILVNLLDHSFFLTSNYFSTKTTAQIVAALEIFQQRLSTYITSNGRNLKESVINQGDKICICALSDDPGNSLPPMLAQLNNPASSQTVLSDLGPTVTVSDFMNSYDSNDAYKPYVWTVEHAPNSGSGSTLAVDQLLQLTNLSTGKKLDGEGANPHHGWVSAEGTNAPLGTSPNKSDVWLLKNRLGYFDSESSDPINSGDVIALHRVYLDTSAGDPAGYLQIRNGKAYSTGQLYGSQELVENDMAFQVFKLNTSS